jgi:hypothetical protein
MTNLRAQAGRLWVLVISGAVIAAGYGFVRGVQTSVWKAEPGWQAALFDGAVVGTILLVGALAECFVPALVAYAIYGGLAGLAGGALFGLPLPGAPLPAGVLAALVGLVGGAGVGVLIGWWLERPARPSPPSQPDSHSPDKT